MDRLQETEAVEAERLNLGAQEVKPVRLTLTGGLTLAAYKYPNFFRRFFGPAFDVIYRPGERPPLSGIYRCTGCGDECACNKDQPLPPQNHHQHKSYRVPIRWRLIVVAEQR